MSKSYDFSGWATRNDIRCSDGRTIRKNAFKANDGKSVPLVWNHQHNDPNNVLGHALLENRDEGVYAYCTLNDTESGQNAKLLVKHGDVTSLSIYANQLEQNGGDVLHGTIREVSLVLAGANPGAFIDSILAHGQESEEEAIIYTGEEYPEWSAEEVEETIEQEETVEQEEIVEHADKEEPVDENTEGEKEMAAEKATNEKTVEEVFNELTEEQKQVVYFLIGKAVEEAQGGEEEKDMKHNVFEDNNTAVLSHSDMKEIIADGKRYGSLKESALQHGITDVEYLFPFSEEDGKLINNVPGFVKRQDEWVTEVMDNVHHTPFSRVKSVFADITGADARARGYTRGNLKANEVVAMLKRVTQPTTVYKKQKLERDDVVDITDFDVVSWLKTEMRMMLDEELARAMLIGDGRLDGTDDKISEQSIRPIWTDADLYTIKEDIVLTGKETPNETAKAFIRAAITARAQYRGSGKPTLFTTDEVLTACLLMEDGIGRMIYDSVEKLATALRVEKIVTVPVMENQTRTDTLGQEHVLAGIIVNMADYNVGADKGGAVNMFDDFDIDYNAQKYLIETRCSGALVKPYSAIALEFVTQEEGGDEGNGEGKE